jgi:LPS export ABC transporter permease LptF/LPS export ABC transporter permease LptG
MARLITRYVLREVLPPFLVGLLLIVFVLLMNQVLLLADLFIDKGVPAPQVLRVLVLLLPSILVFALPMAVLMGILGGLARLSADSEIVALRSLGIGPGRLARPLLVFGFCGFLLTLPLALVLAPRANDAWVRTMTESVLARVPLKVEPLEFNETLPGLVFMAREAGRDGTWHDVFVRMNEDPSRPRFVMARSGRVRLFPEERRAILELVDGTVYAGPLASPGEDTVTTFDRLEEEIDIAGLVPSVSNEKRVREKDIGELVRDLRALDAATPAASPASRQIRAHRVEIHKKLALPAACLIFALIGLPLGVMTGRAGRTGGFSLGLAIILLYYALLTAGEQAAMDGRLSAFLGMWGPDILLAVAGLWLFLAPARRLPAFFSRLFRSHPRLSAPVPHVPGGRTRWRAGFPGFPGLLDRYVSRKFLVILAYAFAVLAAAAFLATFFESLGDVLQRGQPVKLLLRYVGLKMPEFLAFLLPAAVLTAALLALGLLARTNEATALKTIGVSAYRTVLPVLVLAAAAGGLVFLVQDRIVPAAHARAEAVWAALHDLPARGAGSVNRHWVLGANAGRIYHFDYFEPASSAFGRLSVFDIDARRWALVRRTFAEKAAFERDSLVYRDGWTRDYAAASGPAFSRSAAGRVDTARDMDVLRAPWQEPLRMTFGGLRRYTAEVRAMGFPAVRLRAELAQKVSLPFVSLIMALLAVPFGFRMGRKGALVGVGLSVVIAMAYWGTYALFRSLGSAGELPPLLGAWGANILFGLAGAIGLFRVRT